jgi:hypothetical protein
LQENQVLVLQDDNTNSTGSFVPYEGMDKDIEAKKPKPEK